MNSSIIRNCERIGLVLGLLAVGGSLASGQPGATTLGVGLGAGIALLNLILIRKIVTRLLSGGRPDGRKIGVGAAVVVGKLGLLLAAMFVAIKVVGASPMAFMVGVTSVFTSVIVVSFVMALQDPEAMTADGDPASGSGS